jgi:glyoxylase-like metal-dependent hydrolase (beta-lactamase superfamily II)
MVFINSDGKFNDNSYLLDGELYRMKGNLAIYVVENEGMRVMIDTPSELMVRKFIKKLKSFGLFPIHKIILTHSHFDHVQGVGKLKRMNEEVPIEVMASEKAIENLKNPDVMNKDFGYVVKPVENVKPLKEGDIIDVNGLKLEIFNFFGHTQDSIAIIDRKNKNIFVGDSIMDRFDPETAIPEFVPPDFKESEIVKTFQKLRNLKEDLNSICLAHFGVWKDDDFLRILNEMEKLHFDAKELIIKWYGENPSLEYITAKYHEQFTPNSKVHTKENIHGLELVIEWLLKGLKATGDL